MWILNAVLAVSALALYVGGVSDLARPDAPFSLPWWALAAGFCAAEIFVVHVEFRRDAHSVSLSELPLVLGLFSSDPKGLVLAVLVGSTAALVLHRRQSLLKLTFNLGHFVLETCLAVLVFRALATFGDSPGPGDWLAAFLATLVTTFVGIVLIFVAISLSEGAVQSKEFPRALLLGALATATNTSLALVGATLAWNDPVAVWLLVVPAGTLFFAYRAYVSYREKHASLEFLHHVDAAHERVACRSRARCSGCSQKPGRCSAPSWPR